MDFTALFSDPFTLFILLLVNIILSLLIANSADKKGRSFWGFFWLTMIAGPIIMGIVVVAISPITPKRRSVVGSSRTQTSAQTLNDVPSQIERLAELRDKGILTDAEFDQKKQQLLDKI